LEVATKVFVNQDQEVKWETNRKIKRKIDLLTAALVEQSGRSQWANPVKGKGNHHGWCPQDALTPGRN
jgi:hypothetical protein